MNWFSDCFFFSAEAFMKSALKKSKVCRVYIFIGCHRADRVNLIYHFSLSVYPSFYPSRCGILSEWMHVLSNFFRPSGRASILVSLNPTGITVFQGNFIAGEWELHSRGVRKFVIFNWNCHLSWVWSWSVQITNRKSQVANQSVSVPVTMKGGMRGAHFPSTSPYVC